MPWGFRQFPAQQSDFLFEETDLRCFRPTGALGPQVRRVSVLTIGVLWPTAGTIVLHVGTSSRTRTPTVPAITDKDRASGGRNLRVTPSQHPPDGRPDAAARPPTATVRRCTRPTARARPGTQRER
ncbi:hypothetical protein UO65_1757 [Actinokineospora spheciospongiae]|uniref:Uncharacterized protein n=1 Tax=Actinokineospora spheciospongiae TaxID=909613 RepID=W7IRE6_9PSEU|nr:hypothetical protein UO65_1757 [Actinokineospora spheciospongiae]